MQLAFIPNRQQYGICPSGQGEKSPEQGQEPGLEEIAARLSGYHCCNVINNSGGKVKSAQIGVWTYI